MKNSALHQALNDWFHAYVNEFRLADGSLLPMQQLKYDHCQRVSRDARRIAENLNWSIQEVELAETIGLFHDVGRFSQFAEFKTLDDSRSVNHAQRGLDVLLQKQPLRYLAEPDRIIVEDSIKYHNRRTIPPVVSPKSTPFVKLARDADKLDCFFVFADAIHRDTLRQQPEIIWNVPLDGPINPAVLNSLAEGTMISYAEIKSFTDFSLTQLSWMYDINYLPTYRLIVERQVIPTITATLPQDPAVRKHASTIFSFVQDKIHSTR